MKGRLCAMEPCLRLERFPAEAGLEPGISRSAVAVCSSVKSNATGIM